MIRRTLLALLLSVPVSAQPYRNPVIPFTGSQEIADPFVLRSSGEYYLYASGDPIQAWHSRDLVHWERLGPVLRSTPGAWNETDVWAPEVVYRDGKFLMYYTASRKSRDWRVGEMARRVGVASSTSPAGPFVDSGHPVVPGWAIDGTILRDPRSGLDSIFYSVLQEPNHPGAGIDADRLLQWDKAAGEPWHVTQGSLAWEDKDGDPANGSLRYTNEGPTTLVRHGKVYCLYSGGSWDRPTYSVSYAVAERPTGPWIRADAPILRSTPWVDGPGHDAVVKGPNLVDDMHFYHARVQPYGDPWNRVPFADRLYWNGDRPFAPAPTLGYLPAPDRPLLAEYFDDKDSGRWGGEWTVHDGVASLPGELSSHVPLPENFVMELNYRGKLAGLRLGAQRFPLTEGAHPDAHFHQVLVRGNGGELSFCRDGVEWRTAKLSGADRSWALLGPADWDGVFLTAAWDDDLRVRAPGWRTVSGEWSGSKSGWQNRAEKGLAVSTKGEANTRYEFQGTVWPEDRSAPLVARPGPRDQTWKAGIVAGQGSDTLVLAGYDKAIWPLGRFWVQTRVAGQVGKTLEVGMPRGFRYDEPHTIRVVRQDNLWSFFLDGQETASLNFYCPPTRPGVWSENTACTFLDAAWKQLGVERNWLGDGNFECASGGSLWEFKGGARLNESQAYSGVQRLMLPGSGAVARQSLVSPAGRYRLHAFACSAASGQLQIRTGSGARKQQAVGPNWEEVALEFTASPGEAVELVHAGGAWVAVDDVFLERLPTPQKLSNR